MIESSIMKKPGVLSASVALSTCKGKFTYNPEVIGPRAIIDAIKVKSRIPFQVHEYVLPNL